MNVAYGLLGGVASIFLAGFILYELNQGRGGDTLKKIGQRVTAGYGAAVTPV